MIGGTGPWAGGDALVGGMDGRVLDDQHWIGPVVRRDLEHPLAARVVASTRDGEGRAGGVARGHRRPGGDGCRCSGGVRQRHPMVCGDGWRMAAGVPRRCVPHGLVPQQMTRARLVAWRRRRCLYVLLRRKGCGRKGLEARMARPLARTVENPGCFAGSRRHLHRSRDVVRRAGNILDRTGHGRPAAQLIHRPGEVGELRRSGPGDVPRLRRPAMIRTYRMDGGMARGRRREGQPGQATGGEQQYQEGAADQPGPVAYGRAHRPRLASVPLPHACSPSAQPARAANLDQINGFAMTVCCSRVTLRTRGSCGSKPRSRK